MRKKQSDENFSVFTFRNPLSEYCPKSVMLSTALRPRSVAAAYEAFRQKYRSDLPTASNLETGIQWVRTKQTTEGRASRGEGGDLA